MRHLIKEGYIKSAIELLLGEGVLNRSITAGPPLYQQQLNAEIIYSLFQALCHYLKKPIEQNKETMTEFISIDDMEYLLFYILDSPYFKGISLSSSIINPLLRFSNDLSRATLLINRLKINYPSIHIDIETRMIYCEIATKKRKSLTEILKYKAGQVFQLTNIDSHYDHTYRPTNDNNNNNNNNNNQANKALQELSSECRLLSDEYLEVQNLEEKLFSDIYSTIHHVLFQIPDIRIIYRATVSSYLRILLNRGELFLLHSVLDMIHSKNLSMDFSLYCQIIDRYSDELRTMQPSPITPPSLLNDQKNKEHTHNFKLLQAILPQVTKIAHVPRALAIYRLVQTIFDCVAAGFYLPPLLASQSIESLLYVGALRPAHVLMQRFIVVDEAHPSSPVEWKERKSSASDDNFDFIKSNDYYLPWKWEEITHTINNAEKKNRDKKNEINDDDVDDIEHSKGSALLSLSKEIKRCSKYHSSLYHNLPSSILIPKPFNSFIIMKLLIESTISCMDMAIERYEINWFTDGFIKFNKIIECINLKARNTIINNKKNKNKNNNYTNFSIAGGANNHQLKDTSSVEPKTETLRTILEYRLYDGTNHSIDPIMPWELCDLIIIRAITGHNSSELFVNLNQFDAFDNYLSLIIDYTNLSNKSDAYQKQLKSKNIRIHKGQQLIYGSLNRIHARRLINRFIRSLCEKNNSSFPYEILGYYLSKSAKAGDYYRCKIILEVMVRNIIGKSDLISSKTVSDQNIIFDGFQRIRIEKNNQEKSTGDKKNSDDYKYGELIPLSNRPLLSSHPYSLQSIHFQLINAYLSIDSPRLSDAGLSLLNCHTQYGFLPATISIRIYLLQLLLSEISSKSPLENSDIRYSRITAFLTEMRDRYLHRFINEKILWIYFLMEPIKTIPALFIRIVTDNNNQGNQLIQDPDDEELFNKQYRKQTKEYLLLIQFQLKKYHNHRKDILQRIINECNKLIKYIENQIKNSKEEYDIAPIIIDEKKQMKESTIINKPDQIKLDLPKEKMVSDEKNQMKIIEQKKEKNDITIPSPPPTPTINNEAAASTIISSSSSSSIEKKEEMIEKKIEEEEVIETKESSPEPPKVVSSDDNRSTDSDKKKPSIFDRLKRWL